MFSKLPALKAKEVVKGLKAIGFVEKRITGSHIIMKNPKNNKIVVIPTHGTKDIKRGTLFSIIKQAELSVEEFL